MEKLFCPSCGNKTLQKVSVTIRDDGTKQYHYPKRKRNHNIRGTKVGSAYLILGTLRSGRVSIQSPIIV